MLVSCLRSLLINQALLCSVFLEMYQESLQYWNSNSCSIKQGVVWSLPLLLSFISILPELCDTNYSAEFEDPIVSSTQCLWQPTHSFCLSLSSLGLPRKLLSILQNNSILSLP